MDPVRVRGEYVFVTSDAVPPASLYATIREAEGLTSVLERGDADRLGLAYDYVAGWITLQVHSDLAAVGLTAAVSTALAEAGISCNMLAGFHHDHLLVPIDGVDRALEVLTELSQRWGALRSTSERAPRTIGHRSNEWSGDT